MPNPDGTSWTYTPAQMSQLSALNYAYDDVSPPSGAAQSLARLRRLGVPMAAALTSIAMAPKNVELLGANNQSIRVTGTEASTSVALEPAVTNKVTASLRAARAAAPTGAPPAPDRVFLNLENVRSASDGHAFNVYINVPEGEDPTKHPELKAGSFALFGVRKASAPDGEHAGNGVTFVLDISHVIDALHLSGALDAGRLQVRLVARNPVPDAAKMSIGRVSVFRQGR
jgi:tyrosinase